MQSINYHTPLKYILRYIIEKGGVNSFISNPYNKINNYYRTVGYLSSVFTQLKRPHVLLFKTATSLITGTVIYSYIQENVFSLRAARKSSKDFIKEADGLYDQLKFEDIYNLLSPEKESGDDEILWRLARATYEKARKTTDSKSQKALYAEALGYLETANGINANNFAVHKWLAIIMDCYYTMEGTKSRISHLYEMKTHMEKACALKPKDGTSWYVLGMWYFGIANLTWYERKAASLFFATPPESSFDDALAMFQEAERVEPNFYSKNYLMIGKCLYYMGRKDTAREYFIKAKDYDGKTRDDQEAKEEALKFL